MSDPDYICDYCSRSFTRKYNLQTHIENCHLNLSCHCEICDIGFGSPTGLLLHLSRGHNQFNQGFPQCDVCRRVFARRQNIINHMINVHLQTNSVFSCHLCDKTFTTERNMKRHLKLHNRDVASLTCDYCKRIFRKRHAMIVHMQSHEHISKGGMKCQLCERAYANDKDLRRHMKMSHKEKGIFKCKICPKEYTLNQSLRRHTKTVHLSENSEQYTCEYCYKVITGKENLDSHIAFYHKQIGLDIVGSSKYDHFCQSCNMFYKKEHLLRQHIKTTHTFQEFYEYCKESLIKSAEKLEKSKKMKKKCLYCCEYCIQVFSTVYELKYHMKYEHDKDYSLSTCNVCFQKFFSKETIEQHRKKCIRPYNANSCSFCDKLFSDVSSLDFHTRIFHPQSQVADSNITSTLEEANETCHKCTHCERIYYTGRSLKHHLKLKHTADEPVKCKLCEKICNNKYYLASHMKVVHNNTYSSKCDYCDKEFKSKRNIRRHIEYTHLGMQRYKCVECETLFKEKRSLRKHVRMKHPNSAAFPQCHICEKRFESAKSCKIHLKLIHSFNMTTHPCHLCSVSFDSLEALNIHLTTNHSAEDEIYKCEECNLVFQGHEQFGQHCESFHSNLPSLKTCLPRCIICMKDFSSRKTLKRHIKKFHSDFNVDELATYGSRRRVFDVECDECIKNFNDDFYYGIYTKLKHLRDSVVFKCEYCKSSYNSLEFAIQRFKQCFDASQTKLYLSELCTTQMSDDMKSDSAEAMEPESTTVDVKLEPAEVSDESMTSDVKTEHDNIEMFDEFS